MTGARSTMKPGFRAWRGWVVPLLLLAAWEWMAHRNAAHAFVFVPLETLPGAAYAALRAGDLIGDWTASLLRTSLGLAIGATTGIALAAFLAASARLDRLVSPLHNALRQVPLLGWIPLISLWFGNGEPSKLLVIAYAAFNPMVLSTYEGLKTIDSKYLDVARVFRTGRWQVFRRVTLPAAAPAIFLGLMQATAFAWLSSIGGEFFFNPGPGLGNLMLNGQASFQMGTVLLGVGAVTVTGYVMNVALVHIARRSLRWRGTR
jgi:sulfonate transport system permease protein